MVVCPWTKNFATWRFIKKPRRFQSITGSSARIWVHPTLHHKFDVGWRAWRHIAAMVDPTNGGKSVGRSSMSSSNGEVPVEDWGFFLDFPRDGELSTIFNTTNTTMWFPSLEVKLMPGDTGSCSISSLKSSRWRSMFAVYGGNRFMNPSIRRNWERGEKLPPMDRSYPSLNYCETTAKHSQTIFGTYLQHSSCHTWR